MTKYFIIIVLLFNPPSAFSQSVHKIYFSKYNYDTVTSEKYDYYRIENKKDGFYEVKDYDINDQIYMSGYRIDSDDVMWVNEKIFYYPGGQMKSKTMYKDGNKHGADSSFYENGFLEYVQNYTENNLSGEQVYYFEDGLIVRRKEMYDKGVKSDGVCYDIEGSEIPYFERFVGPKMEGVDIHNFLAKNISYPEESASKGIGGSVLLAVEIDEKGRITKIIPLEAPDENILLETIRVVRLSQGKWTPALLEGQPVKTMIRVPCIFRMGNY